MLRSLFQWTRNASPQRAETVSAQSQVAPAPGEPTFKEWIRAQVEAESYWFHRIALGPDLVTPGWSDPKVDKLPYYGLPEDMSGMRVLDVGCAEGFFSLEAEARGADEIVAIDSFPDSIRRCNIVKNALGSKKINAYLCNVYDLNPRAFGTFDFVFFFGVLYHLRHPILALERILSVCTGTMLMQTLIYYDEQNVAMAQFHPFGIESGPKENPIFDPTVFWVPNAECTRALPAHVGFTAIEDVQPDPSLPFVIRAQAPVKSKGAPPDEKKAPWS